MKTKFNTNLRVVRGEEKGKLPITHCRKVLGKEGEKLTDQEILEIRDFFYQLAEITMEQYQHEKSQGATVINLEQNKSTQNEKESNYLRAS
jgi:hypothetical protein